MYVCVCLGFVGLHVSNSSMNTPTVTSVYIVSFIRRDLPGTCLVSLADLIRTP